MNLSPPEAALPLSVPRQKAVSIRSFAKAALLLSSFVVLLAGGMETALAQSALDGFDPNANGIVQVVVVQPDGKILLGGDFTSLAPNGGVSVPRNHMARLNADGSLDTDFNPNADGSVFSIVVQPDGKILAGGNFTGIGGQPRNYLARLDAATGLSDSFNPNANGAVVSIALQPDGKILAGGAFSGSASIGGQTRNYIARLDPATGLADSFNPNANGLVYSIALQADGKILAGGLFSGANSIGGQARNFIVRLDPVTGLADSFNPNATGFFVQTIAVQADGQILAGGAFSSIGGQPRNRIARLNPVTGLADSFNPNADATVNSIVVQADGRILAGGSFHLIGGQTRNRIARLDPGSGLADSFDPNATVFLGVYSIAVQTDGKILAGGNFTALAPNGGASVTRNYIARLEPNGRVDQTLNLNLIGSVVYATAVQPDGRILIGGTFATILGVPRSNIARLHPDGSLDLAFNPGASGNVYSFAVEASGGILVGGAFNGANSIGGQPRNYIARLNSATGAVDPSFNPNANGAVGPIVVQDDGKILVGGEFSPSGIAPNSIGGQPRKYIARLDPVTGQADSFNPNANNVVTAIAVQADGKILAGGGFAGPQSIGGQPRNRIARLDPVTGVADSFDPNASEGSGGFAVVRALAVQPDGKILAGGEFTNIGGQPRNCIARLDPVTGLADSFNPNASYHVYTLAVQADGKVLAGGVFNAALGMTGGQPRNRIARLDPVTGLADSFNPNANGEVRSITVQRDGRILAGGFFSGANSIGGQARERFARLSNDTPALEKLFVTADSVTWARGGSSPMLTRVSFDYTIDHAVYTFLGHGTASDGNWTLTGLNLPMGQNLFVRARGHYRSGFSNASESFTESERNALPAAVIKINSITRSPNGAIVIQGVGIPNTVHRIEGSTSMTPLSWTLSGDPMADATGAWELIDTSAPGVPRRFYRVVIPQ